MMVGLSHAFKNDDYIVNKLQSLHTNLINKMFDGLFALFDAVQKFMTRMPRSEKLILFIATSKIREYVSFTQWNWEEEKRKCFKVTVQHGVFVFETPMKPGVTSIRHKHLKKHFKDWFMNNIGETKVRQMSKTKVIFTYIGGPKLTHEEFDKIYDFGQLLVVQIPHTSVKWGLMLEVKIPFDESSVFSPPPLNINLQSVTTSPVRNVLDGDRMIRNIIDDEPYMSTSRAQHLLSVGHLDTYLSNTRDAIKRRISNRTRGGGIGIRIQTNRADTRMSHIQDAVNRRITSGGGTRKITGKSRAAA